MATSDSGLRDDLQVDLNGTPVDAVPARPRDNAPTAAWLAYVVALGASADVGETTEHYDDTTGGYVTSPPASRTDLIALADRLA